MAAGEQKLLLVWSVMVTTAANQVRDLRVDGLSAHAAERILDSAIAIEKAMAAVKVLVADRAAEGSGWRARGARSAEEDLARRLGDLDLAGQGGAGHLQTGQGANTRWRTPCGTASSPNARPR